MGLIHYKLVSMFKSAGHSKEKGAAIATKSNSFFGALIQPRLSINQPNDVYEQEANAVATKVMTMPATENATETFFKPAASIVQRKCAHCEEEEQIQRKEENDETISAGNELEHYVGGIGNSGESLPAETRSFFEPRFGYDFSGVKIHTDHVAAKSAQSVNALAYTAGSNIVFNNGQYAPQTDSGKRLLAHELTHVVQQGGQVQKKSGDEESLSATLVSPSLILRNVPPPPPPPPTSDTLSSCNATQTPVVNTAISNARTWINNVEPRLTAFNGGTAPASDQTIITNALNHNFHTTTAGDVATITANITTLRTALNSFLDIECVSSFWCDEDVLAYVRGRFAWVRKLGDVNLCPLFFTCSNGLKRDSTIVHEVSHQYPGTDDKAYEHEAGYATLSSTDAMDNAASYEVFTREVYHNGSHGPGESC